MGLVERQKVFFSIILLGFIAGILYVNLLASDYLMMTGIFNSYYLQEFTMSNLSVEDYLPNVLYVRITPVIILLIVAYSKWNKVVVYCFCAWTGFLSGIYMSLGIAQVGFKGIILCILGIFPHMVFYGISYLIILIFVYKYPKSGWSAIKILVVMMCMVSGVVLEVLINPQILKWFIGIM